MANEEFCKNYLLLDAENASFFDLIRILYSNDLEKRNFFDSLGENSLTSFRRRWLVFVSVSVQKLLVWLRDPLAWIGSNLQFLLNYAPSNGGYFSLLFNILKGRVVRPDESSARFWSWVGLLDMRVELDSSNITKGDSKYVAALCVMAAKLSYENEALCRTVVTDLWQMEFLGFYNFWNDYQNQASTQAIMFQDKSTDPNLVIVAFRGTEPFSADDWRTDVDLSWYKLDGIGKLHAGFMKALGMRTDGWPEEIGRQTDQKQYAYYTVREKLRNIMRENRNARFIVTGHSLGGALSVLFPAILFFHEEELLLQRCDGVYTFGQPRVGDEEFGKFMEGKLGIYGIRYFRYVYANDIVPRLPYDDRSQFYKHFGPSLYYNSCYKGQILEEEPNKNYFSLLWVLPKYLNAVYELIRSFIIPFTRGAEYREGWPQILFRLFGLLIPGLPDHGLLDYVNVTRLGTSPSSLQPEGKILQQNPKDD